MNTSSDYNLETLTPKQLERHITCSIEAGSNLLVVGRRGTGKSVIAKERIKASGYRCVFFNLATKERPDLGGYPDLFNATSKFVSFKLPNKFRPLVEGDEKCVLLLDELDKAETALNSPLLEILEEHAVDGDLFPNLVCTIATGNLISEGGNKPIPPLLDRTEKYLLEANNDDWQEWAGRPEARIHPSIVSFMYDHPDKLVGAVESPHNYASPSPRSWFKVSNMIHHGEKHDWDIDIINEKVAGFVGKKAALDFVLYYSKYKVLLPIVDMVFEGKDYGRAFYDRSPTEQLYISIIVSSRLTAIFDANKPTALKDTSSKTAHVRSAYKAVGGFFQMLYDCHPEFAFTCIQNTITNARWPSWNLNNAPEWGDVLRKLNLLSKGK
jgi:hypothetical protein